MPKTICSTCSAFTHHKPDNTCFECGTLNDYNAIFNHRDIDPQPDPVMTFMVLSWDEYPDNDTEVIVKWFADGKAILLGKLDAKYAMDYRSRIVVSTDKTKGMKVGMLHKYISERPHLYDKNQ